MEIHDPLITPVLRHTGTIPSLTIVEKNLLNFINEKAVPDLNKEKLPFSESSFLNKLLSWQSVAEANEFDLLFDI